MGYAFCTSSCFGCRRIFSYNPMQVPSIRVNGNKEPVCQDCIERVNPLRIKNGLEPIRPLPGAYDACDESELS